MKTKNGGYILVQRKHQLNLKLERPTLS